jgi:hypothetical protein
MDMQFSPAVVAGPPLHHDLALALAAWSLLVIVVVVVLAVVVVAIRREERRMSLAEPPGSRAQALTRRVLGMHVSPPEAAPVLAARRALTAAPAVAPRRRPARAARPARPGGAGPRPA